MAGRPLMGRVIVAAVTLLCCGCGAHGVGAVASFGMRVLDVGDDATVVVGVESLELPGGGELVIEPVRLSVNAAYLHDDRPLRAQIVLRGLRPDGGTLQWFVGADGRASAGERGFQLGSPRAREATFGGADYGPVPVASLTALQVAVALVPVEPRDSAGFVGLGATLELHGDHDMLRAALAEDGATLLMASQLPIKPAVDAAPGTYTQRLVIVGTSTLGHAGPGRIHALRGGDALSATQERVDDVNVLVLDLHVEVPHHE